MSYTIHLRGECAPCPTCGHVRPTPDLPDPTYNLREMFWAALVVHEQCGLRALDGQVAGGTTEALRLACVALDDPANEARFRAMEPENKWGTLEGARRVMHALHRAAIDYPEHVWEIS